MATAKKPNLFRAGSGLTPPYIAGRQNEIDFIEDALDAIKGGAGQMANPPYPILVLVGPRGVGKTVLLTRAIKGATARSIHTSKISRNLLVGPQKELVNHVFPDGLLKKMFERIDRVKLEYKEAGFTVGLKDALSNFRSAVLAFLSKKPLLLVLDEAHHCEPEVLNLLFEIAQDCMSVEMPLALILAGTPGIEPLIQRCEATYVERSRFLRINTLSDDEAKEAFEIPARKAGLPMEPGALKILLDWADNYPFFIQMAGMYVCDITRRRSGGEISIDDAKAGLAKANPDRTAFYEKRYSELDDRDLEQYAIQSIKIIQGCKDENINVFTLRNMLMEANEGMDKKSAKKAVVGLQEEGFLWVRDNQAEPGIPSMFDYVIRKYGT